MAEQMAEARAAEAERIAQARSEAERIAQVRAARRREWVRTRWPADVVVDKAVLAIDDIADQVDAQNDKIDEQVDHLSNLLVYGLVDVPSKSSR